MNQTTATSRKQLRQFGTLVGAIFIGIGLWQWYRESFETGRLALWIVGGTLFAGGLVAPTALAPLYRVWMKLAHGLAWINTRILLTLIFFLVMTPMGFLMKIIKGGLLTERFDRNAGSYWETSEPIESVREHCERQF